MRWSSGSAVWSNCAYRAQIFVGRNGGDFEWVRCCPKGKEGVRSKCQWCGSWHSVRASALQKATRRRKAAAEPHALAAEGGKRVLSLSDDDVADSSALGARGPPAEFVHASRTVAMVRPAGTQLFAAAAPFVPRQ